MSKKPAPPLDGHGNLTSYTNGGGTWILNYDSLNRLTSRVDPDPQNPTSYFYYNPDDSVYLAETPYQHSLSKGHAFTYDADGDVLTQTVHRNGAQGMTTKAYDGLDRLVEVQEPYSSSGEVLTSPWITRYFYDLTQGHTVSFNNSSNYSAYGDLYATEELLPPGVGPGGSRLTYSGGQVTGNYSFVPLKGTQYDALDRGTGSYTIVNGGNALATTTYDGAGQEGLPAQQCQPPIPGHTLCKNFYYDNDSRVTSITYSDSTSTTRSFTYDAAGHTLTAANGDGTQTYWYDLEGRIVNAQEPNQGTSRATYTHEFYADGKLKQLDVSSKHFTQNGLFVYAYTPPGQLQAETIAYAASSINTTVNFMYTAAGRLLQRSESGSDANPNPTTFGYDNYGQLNSSTYPGQQSNPLTVYNYDPEGDLTSFGTTQNTQTFSYTIRGELLPPVSWFPVTGPTIMANGVQVPTGTSPFQSTWDARMGVLGAITTNYGNQSKEGSTSYSYDGAGRQSQINSTNCDYGGCNTITTTATKRSYDVDNHTLDTTQVWTYSGGGQPFASNVSVYDWGPSDHPIRIGSADALSETPPPDSAATYDTLHWDGDQLIFATNGGGGVDDIKVGGSGDITPLDTGYARLTFWDRGPGGAVLFCHNSLGSAGAGQVLQLPYQTAFNSTPCTSQGQLAKNFPNSIMWFNGPSNQNGKPRTGGPGQGNLLGMYRPDGISDGVNTIQGVRAVDASSSNWTTPDAFAGVVEDPATQKSYAWSGSNTLKFVDPTGYFISQGPEDGGGADYESAENIAYAIGGKEAGAVAAAQRLASDPGWTAADEAAYDATKKYLEIAQKTKSEWGGRVGCDLSGLTCRWSLSPDSGNHRVGADCGERGCEIDLLEAPVPQGTHTVALWHDHWGDDHEMFSSNDFETSINLHVPLYLGTPSGNLLRTTEFNAPMAEFKTGKFVVLCTGCL